MDTSPFTSLTKKGIAQQNGQIDGHECVTNAAFLLGPQVVLEVRLEEEVTHKHEYLPSLSV